MGRQRTVAAMRCAKHPGAAVIAFGTRTTASGRQRRYRCAPLSGDAHVFHVPLDDEGTPQLRGWSPPPPCPEHPTGKVVRNGTYGVRTPQPRQRYRCTPPGDGKAHTFTPALPRHHVHEHEHGCVECEELRGVHRGETAVARRHSWPTRIVARALSQLADAGSYADVSRQALAAAEIAAQRHEALVRGGLSAEQADVVVEAEQASGDAGAAPPTVAAALAKDREEAASDTATAAAVAEDRARYRRSRRRAPSPPATTGEAASVTVVPDIKPKRKKSASSVESANVWHIAADWTEAFGPVVFEPIEARLRAQALAERARIDALREAGQPVERPQVLLLDDVPVYGRDRSGSGKARRDDGFFLLVAAEILWRKGPGRGVGDEADPFALATPEYIPELTLRLVRAMPKSNTAAWRLVLDELGYAPDFVVADAGTGIARAIAEQYNERTTFIPSLWHVGQAIRNGLAETRGALVPVPGGGREPLPSLRKHLSELGRDRAIADVPTWTAWWDELERLCVAESLPLDKIRNRRRNYETTFAEAIRALAGQPGVPVSTGGLETLMAKRVQPMLAMRRTSFGNIERTNRLFDLLIAREHGAFIDLTDVVTLLRNDAVPEGGWTVPLRDISDPRPRNGRYNSLRDSLLITEIAESRGLA